MLIVQDPSDGGINSQDELLIQGTGPVARMALLEDVCHDESFVCFLPFPENGMNDNPLLFENKELQGYLCFSKMGMSCTLDITSEDRRMNSPRMRAL